MTIDHIMQTLDLHSDADREIVDLTLQWLALEEPGMHWADDVVLRFVVNVFELKQQTQPTLQ